MRFLVNIVRVLLHLLGLVAIAFAVLGPISSPPGDLSLHVTLDCAPGATGQQQCSAQSPGLVSRDHTTIGDLSVPLAVGGLTLQVLAIGMSPALWSRLRSDRSARATEAGADDLSAPLTPPTLGRGGTPAKQAGRWFNG